MHFTAATLFALVSTVLAQTSGFDAISKPADGEKVPAGSTYSIVWDYTSQYSGTVSLELMGGSSPSTLNILSTIASGVDNSKGTYGWAVDKSLGSFATYGIKITLDNDSSVFQYSFPFAITGGSASSASGTVTTASSSGGSSKSTGTSAPTTTSSSTSGSIVSTSTSTTAKVVSTSSAYSNLSTTAGSPGVSQTTITTVTTPGSSATASKTTTSATTVPTNGAATVAAGSFAALAGLAMAVFAL